MKVFLASVTLLSATAGSVAADVLLNQPHDYRTAVLSDWRPGGLSPQVGDDFTPHSPVIIDSVTFWMVGSWAVPPYNWAIAVHRSTTEHIYLDFAPEYDWFFERTGASDIINHGQWNDQSDLRLYEIRYDDLDLLLDPATSERGTFWFSSFGHILDRNTTTSMWGTAGNGELNGDGAWWKTIPWIVPGWKPLYLPDDSRSDFAMRIEGHYVPAAGALIPLALLAGGCKRRRR